MDVGFSKCDPYVILNHGPLEKRTSVASGTNPTWKESLAFSMEVPETELQVDRVFLLIYVWFVLNLWLLSTIGILLP